MLTNSPILTPERHVAVKIDNLSKYYGYKGRIVAALDGIDLTIQSREHVCIVGRSGSGKSTLTRMICGIETPTKGSIKVFGLNPHQLLYQKRVQYSKIVQLVRQESYMSFDPLYKIQDALMRIVKLHQDKNTRQTDYVHFVYNMMYKYEMQDLIPLLLRKPKELSGGQLQRFAFLRALLVSPRIIVADEPTAMLDAFTTERMITAFGQIPSNTTFIYITHNNYLSSTLSNRIIHIQNGKCI